eukprot:CAMPEP_0115071804 /NCGR_PEP_ID=MMETSP0227-20121206/13879_1 /TAXON_ID=89957 /ORGANISM="Polarella glacialis, Strain CCMP 1383" /LENGTH=152 /DNA_ID=CAMNT_0002458483 /DNA_START=50 /DNA_END=505 /DNA_ORIENTATION=-
MEEVRQLALIVHLEIASEAYWHQLCCQSDIFVKLLHWRSRAMEDVRQLALVVNLEIAPEHLDGFAKVMLPHADNSRKEYGCLRFDVLQVADAPNKFTLYEVYKSAEDLEAHQKTDSFKRWKEFQATNPSALVSVNVVKHEVLDFQGEQRPEW